MTISVPVYHVKTPRPFVNPPPPLPNASRKGLLIYGKVIEFSLNPMNLWGGRGGVLKVLHRFYSIISMSEMELQGK